ncbi:MAG: enoyl-CoA hydratase-related protein [Alphaproteobacteria bacterium]
MSYEFILAEKQGVVGVITLNRPKSLNAVCEGMVKEIALQLNEFDLDEEIGAVVITGSDKAFAAGADIPELINKGLSEVYLDNYMVTDWNKITNFRKPLIAAVAGYALGIGCELALVCDFIIAADNAKFGQPEVSIGMIPGFGGTQRLTKLIGKSKAMEMILTGRSIDADEAERAGMISRIVPLAELMTDALKSAEKIALFSRPNVLMAKEAVKKADEMSVSDGLAFEKALFCAGFGTEDHFEGLAAFMEKRPPAFGNK